MTHSTKKIMGMVYLVFAQYVCTAECR